MVLQTRKMLAQELFANASMSSGKGRGESHDTFAMYDGQSWWETYLARDVGTHVGDGHEQQK